MFKEQFDEDKLDKNDGAIRICQVSNVRNDNQKIAILYNLKEFGIFYEEYVFDFKNKKITLYANSLIIPKEEINELICEPIP